MDVFFAQLKHQNVKQQEAYQTTQLLGLWLTAYSSLYELRRLEIFVLTYLLTYISNVWRLWSISHPRKPNILGISPATGVWT